MSAAPSDKGVTGNAVLLLGYLGAVLDGYDDPTYRVLDVDPAGGRLVLEHCLTKNTYVVSVVQLTGVE